MSEETDLIGTADVVAELVDGRLTMHTEDDMVVYLSWPEETPLSRREPHAHLHVDGDDALDVEVELTGEHLDVLTDACRRAQRHHGREESDGNV